MNGTSFTISIITIVIESFWTITLWIDYSISSTNGTVFDLSFTTITSIITIMTNTSFVSSGTVWTITMWGIVLSSGSTGHTVTGRFGTSETLDGTRMTVSNTGIKVSINTVTRWGNSFLGIFTDVTIGESGTGDTFVGTILTGATGVFIITSSTGTEWGIDSVGITS